MRKTDIFFQKYSYLPIVYNFNFYKPFIDLKKAKLAWTNFAFLINNEYSL